jgi:peptidyl-prolyl cis-trans isomerase D
MLQYMRKLAKSWLATILLGGIALSFALWGIGDVFRNVTSADTSVASVGDTKVSAQEFERDYKNLSRNVGRGQDIPPELAKKLGLPDRALQSAINQTALDFEVNHLGLTLGDAQISNAVRSVQAFTGPLGTFDHQVFVQRLQELGFTEQGFIDAMRNDGARQQVLNAARNGFAVPPTFARALFGYLNERRAVEYIVVPLSAIGEIPEPGDAQLKTFIAAHQGVFDSPEYRALTYAVIGPDDVLAQINPTDAQIKNQYEINKADPAKGYLVPETREVEQINFKDEAGAKAARTKIDAGATLADIAKAQGSQPIALGEVSQSQLGDRGPAVFALPLNGVTQPVKNLAGYAMFHVTKITPGVNKTLADVKEDIRKDLKLQLAQEKMSDYNRAYTDASSSGLDLAAAARKAGMRVVHVPAVDANGMAPDGSKANIPDDPVFHSLIFKAEVGEEGDPVSGKDAQIFVLKVDSDTPSRPKPLAEVRAQAAAMWVADQQQKALEARAKALADQVNARKHSLADAAATLNAKPQMSGMLNRDKGTADLPMELIGKIFAVPGGTAVYGPSATGGNYVVAQVTGVKHPPPPLSNPEYQKFVDEVGAGTAEDIATGIAQAERDKQGVTINQKQVDAVIGSGGEGS